MAGLAVFAWMCEDNYAQALKEHESGFVAKTSFQTSPQSHASNPLCEAHNVQLVMSSVYNLTYFLYFISFIFHTWSYLRCHFKFLHIIPACHMNMPHFRFCPLPILWSWWHSRKWEWLSGCHPDWQPLKGVGVVGVTQAPSRSINNSKPLRGLTLLIYSTQFRMCQI